MVSLPPHLLPKHASECMEVLADVYENWSAAESLERFDCDPGYHSEITMRAFGGTINDSSMTVRRRDPPHSQPMCLGWVCGGNTTICSSSMTYEKRWTPPKQHQTLEAAPLTNAFFFRPTPGRHLFISRALRTAEVARGQSFQYTIVQKTQSTSVRAPTRG